MTFEERMAAIDSFFDSITSDEFNELLETKYGIPRNEDDSINEDNEFPEHSNLTVECSARK